MEQTLIQPQVQPQPQGTYQPVGVPAPAVSHPGRVLAIIGIFCGVIAIVILPPVLGIIGLILGIIATVKGEKALGITAIALSVVGMVLGMIVGFYLVSHPDLLKTKSAATGAIIESLSQ